MTVKKYMLLLAIAFVMPGVVLYGGLFIITCSDRLSTWFTDQLFKAVGEDKA